MAWRKSIVPSDTTVLPGMQILPADKSQTGIVNYFPDIPYVQREEESLLLQLLLPCGLAPGTPSDRTFPLVVFVQGAAWGEQEKYRNIPQLVQVAREGFVVASVKHRAATVAKFPAFLQDIKAAIRFLRAHAKEYYIDPEQVAIWGDSSGGHAAQMVGVTGDMELFKTEEYREYSDVVQVVVDFYGPSDISQVNNKPRDPFVVADKSRIPEDILFGGCVAEHPELAEPGNPLNYIKEGTPLPPFLVVHGDEDPVVPFNQSVLTVQKLQKTGHAVHFCKVTGAGHGAFLWTDQVLDVTVRFLKAWLAP